eukprot:1105019-Prymnesium_polylepis.1
MGRRRRRWSVAAAAGVASFSGPRVTRLSSFGCSGCWRRNDKKQNVTAQLSETREICESCRVGDCARDVRRR